MLANMEGKEIVMLFKKKTQKNTKKALSLD